MKKLFLRLFGLLLAVAAGCAPVVPPETGTPATAGAGNVVVPSEETATATAAVMGTYTPIAVVTGTVTVGTLPSPPTTVPELLGLPQVEQAKADLAVRLNAPPDDIAVVTVQAVTWPDGSFGCPQPGMVYAQVLQEGLFVQLQHAGQVYNYHSGGAQPPFLCEQSFPTDKSTPIFGEDMPTPPDV